MFKNIIYPCFIALFLISACTAASNPKDNTNDKIDSMVNARVDSIVSKLKLKNDSAINALAIQKAQSLKK